MKTRIFSRPHPPLPPPVCFTFFSMSLYDFFSLSSPLWFSSQQSDFFYHCFNGLLPTRFLRCSFRSKRADTPLRWCMLYYFLHLIIIFFPPLISFPLGWKRIFFPLSLSLSLSLSFFFEVLIVHVLKSCISRKSVLRREWRVNKKREKNTLLQMCSMYVQRYFCSPSNDPLL